MSLGEGDVSSLDLGLRPVDLETKRYIFIADIIGLSSTTQTHMQTDAAENNTSFASVAGVELMIE